MPSQTALDTVCVMDTNHEAKQAPEQSHCFADCGFNGHSWATGRSRKAKPIGVSPVVLPPCSSVAELFRAGFGGILDSNATRSGYHKST